MDFLNELFGGNQMTQAEFEAALNSHADIKLVNLADGDYVSKSKYTDTVNELNDKIKNRDASISDLRDKLAKAGTEKTAEEWQAEVDALKTKNEQDKQEYTSALEKQQYKNDCKDFARDIQFTSKGARDAFVNAMIAKNLERKDGQLVGADDFRKEYEEKDPDSFVKENHNPRFVDRQKPQKPGQRTTLSELMTKTN